MILRAPSTVPTPNMGAPSSSRRGFRNRPDPLGLRVRIRPDPNLGGFFDSVTSVVGSALSTAYHTTQQSISIPLQTVSAIASGNVSQVPSLLHQAAATVPLIGNAFGGGMFGSGASTPSFPGSAPPVPAEATASTTGTLQAAQAAATQGLTPGTPQYTAALQAAGLPVPASGPPWGLIIGAGAGVAVLAVLLRRRPA